MRIALVLSIAALTALIMAGLGLASAAPVSLGQDLMGGGPGGSIWEVVDDSGTDNGLPTGGTCDGLPALGISDAELDPGDVTVIGGQSDAYDEAAILWLDNNVFVAPDPVDLTGQTLTAGPVAMSGLNVTMQYYAAAGSATLRTLITFQNPSGAPINASADWVNNHGSDDGTEVQGTSSGDMAFTTADRWIVTSDDNTSPSDPVNTYVLFGPGSPAVTPSSASLVVFDCADTDGVMDTFDISVPAGATRSLLFFNQMNQTNAEGLTGGAGFDTNPALGGDLLSGLTQQQLSEVLNWAFGGPPPADTPTEPAPSSTPAATAANTAVAPTATTAPISAPETGTGGDSSAPTALWLTLAVLMATFAGAGAVSFARRR